MTITGCDAMIVSSGYAIITLPMSTQITIDDALLYPDSTRTLLNYRDIRQHGFYIETHDDNKEEYLLLPKTTDLASFPTYHLDCTIHTSNPYHILCTK